MARSFVRTTWRLSGDSRGERSHPVLIEASFLHHAPADISPSLRASRRRVRDPLVHRLLELRAAGWLASRGSRRHDVRRRDGSHRAVGEPNLGDADCFGGVRRTRFRLRVWRLLSRTVTVVRERPGRARAGAGRSCLGPCDAAQRFSRTSPSAARSPGLTGNVCP